MLHDKELLVVCPGSRAVFVDAEGNRVEGFVELIDPDVGLAWIREQATGERRLITQDEYPLVTSDWHGHASGPSGCTRRRKSR